MKVDLVEREVCQMIQEQMDLLLNVYIGDLRNPDDLLNADLSRFDDEPSTIIRRRSIIRKLNGALGNEIKANSTGNDMRDRVDVDRSKECGL